MILQGEVLEQLANLDDESVQCVVTSPPYWNLRDYGDERQIGLEKTPEEYIEKLVEVFAEVRRVLRSDGVLWLNLGDSYARQAGDDSKKAISDFGGRSGPQIAGQIKSGNNSAPAGFKPKDLIGIPWRVAFALQADGWYLRCDVVWSKPNPMPESVTDRPTRSHEFVFMMTKSAQYYYDGDAIKTEMAESSIQRINQESFNRQRGGPKDPINGGEGSANRSMRKGLESLKAKHGLSSGEDLFGEKVVDSDKQWPGIGPKHAAERDRGEEYVPMESHQRVQRRSVWVIATQPYPEAHFAVFPKKLVRLCILAASKYGDTILDPFGGSGTTAEVAQAEDREWVLIELNPDYIPLIEKRVAAKQEMLRL